MYKTISNKIIREFKPCYDPSEVIKDENEELPVKEWIQKYMKDISSEDILWLLLRREFLSEKDLRMFAVWCAREALKLIEKPDHRCIEACDVAERYANGEATEEELLAARNAANEAANEAAHYVAHYADDIAVYDKADIAYIASSAYSVAYAYYAAYSASYFTYTTAYEVSNDASYAISYAADAAYAANDTVYATSAADYFAARSAQLYKLLTYFE
jgi:hypothetical protein